MTQTTTAVAVAPPAITRPASRPMFTSATARIAGRALRKYFRTPGLLIMGIVQTALFLFMFRYVFGGAIQVGAAGYAGYLIPGYVATIVLFTGGGIAVAVAEDKAQGLTDRLLSLPIARGALVAGRTVADFITNGWSILFTAALGFAFGFRLPGTAVDGFAALGLCLLYGLVFTVVFIVIGLFAPNAQAAQGMSMVAFVLAFVSSTYVPAHLDARLAAAVRQVSARHPHGQRCPLRADRGKSRPGRRLDLVGRVDRRVRADRRPALPQCLTRPVERQAAPAHWWSGRCRFHEISRHVAARSARHAGILLGNGSVPTATANPVWVARRAAGGGALHRSG
jgi:ABC-2 type transport system permease protein